MKKDLLIGLLIVLAATSLAFGIHQKIRADRYALIANEKELLLKDMAAEVEEHANQLEHQIKLMEHFMVEAERARANAGNSSTGK